ncbi:hypothetical protein HHK36_016093 [Tetracentron sinense]|uniref:Prephenate/arogenate dehydrogenase domain-containing protein n=1 Tax=Tetracentron sinense TaxID=13715 RepID=A0A835DBM4_TETSI|nr:hypothetical protein HHK36_016093 [Tetracentron sinense]
MSTSSSSTSRTLKIGMVGFGTFSQFLANPMIKQGHTLTAMSRSDHSQLCSQIGITFFSEVEMFLEAENDVILLCTSIISSSDVIRSMPLHRLKRPTLFADVLSVKEHPRDLLLQELPEEADVLCTHPMFGPESGKHGWRDLPFVYERVRIRDQDICARFLQVFEIEARLQRMEQAILDGQYQFEEMGIRIEGVEDRLDGLKGEMQGTQQQERDSLEAKLMGMLTLLQGQMEEMCGEFAIWK